MKIVNITPNHDKYGQEINVIKDKYVEVIKQSVSEWFNNETYKGGHCDPIDFDDGYQLNFYTKEGGPYTIRIFK